MVVCEGAEDVDNVVPVVEAVEVCIGLVKNGGVVVVAKPDGVTPTVVNDPLEKEVHRTPASSECPQLCTPQLLAGH